MEIEVLYRPAYSLGVVTLTEGESVVAEAGSLVSMTYGFGLETTASGGLIKSIARRFLTGESFFQNIYTAPEGGGEICLAPALPGDLAVLDLESESMLVQAGSFLACEYGINLETKWGGAKTFFASEGLVMLGASGSGKLLLSSYGAIHERILESGETYTVDTGHLVAFTETLGFRIKRVGNMKSTFFSGEGFVVDLTGPGRVLMQTRSTQSFISWLIPKIGNKRPNIGGTAQQQTQ